MTTFHKDYRNCPYCMSEEVVTLWDRLDAREDPDLKQRLLRKELQVLDCQNCGRRFVLGEPLLYLDATVGLLAYVSPSLHDVAEEKGAIALRLEDLHLEEVSLEDYPLRRLCSDYSQLLEKIHLADAGLDDRLVEVMKLAARSRLHSDEGRLVRDLYFLAADEQELLFFTAYEEGETEEISLDRNIYYRAEEMLRPRLQTEESSSWLMIDEAYARRLIGENSV